MLKKIRDFYQKEYEITKQEVAKISLFPVQANVVLGAIQRILGIADFHMEGSYDIEIAELYCEYKEKLLELLR